MHLKRFLPGLLLGLIFIGFFIVGLNSYNPGLSAAAPAPVAPIDPVTTSPDVPTAPAPLTPAQPEPPALAAVETPPDQLSAGTGEIPPADSPVAASQSDNSSEVPVAAPVVEDQSTIVTQPEQKESGEMSEVSEKASHSEKHEEDGDDD
ncbi:MAG: hypothetical protein J0I20_05445 [Chloroflexi bacterium]|nr:hypothetical protein [Chloroflexota bacterium]OJV90058.1 MAG: hypothetical protein BGO39_01375 [Chloroflexi bacterium 54-19]